MAAAAVGVAATTGTPRRLHRDEESCTGQLSEAGDGPSRPHLPGGCAKRSGRTRLKLAGRRQKIQARGRSPARDCRRGRAATHATSRASSEFPCGKGARRTARRANEGAAAQPPRTAYATTPSATASLALLAARADTGSERRRLRRRLRLVLLRLALFLVALLLSFGHDAFSFLLGGVASLTSPWRR